MGVSVLHVVSLLEKEMGGSVIAAFDIAACSEGEEVNNEVLGTHFDHGTVDHFRSNYSVIPVRSFKVRFLRHSFFSPGLVAWLWNNASRYDVIHCHSIFKFPTVIGAFIAIWKRIPLVISPHNSLDPYDLRKKAFIKSYFYGPLILKNLLTKSNAILCTAPIEADRLVTFSKKKLTKKVIPLPVSVNHHEPVDSEYCNDLGINKDDLVILFMSRIDPKKGIEFLIDSLKYLREKNVKLIIAGSGEDNYLKEINKLVLDSRLGDKVIFTGFISGAQKDALFRRADIFALPSYNENFGIVVVEAMSYGTAILISNEVYIHPILRQKNAAVICEPSAESVNSKLDRLIHDPELRSQISENAKINFRIFTPLVLKESYVKFYQGLSG